MTKELIAELHAAKPQSAQRIIELCQYNFFSFMQTLNPNYLYGDIHQEVASFLSNPDSEERQLLLLPRGHLKSHIIACLCVWQITFKPWTTIVYLASQEDLAKAQLYAIKQMMTSDIYTALWPEMFSEESGIKGERGAWSAFAFDVDHPARKARGVRDHTVLIKTIKSNAQGLHCDGLIYDDVVVPNFADSETGRTELARSLGYFSSILNPGGWIKAVGTRYHPEDAYQNMIDEQYGVWDEEVQDFTEQKPLWETMERVVEDSFDRSGTGKFLWPRSHSVTGEDSYGFDINVLSKIKAGYGSRSGATSFYSQYYNDPNTGGTERISRSNFQYYDPKHLFFSGRSVYFQDQPLNVYCAMDVAWSEKIQGDYTAIAVIGIDPDSFIYVLDLDQFKTSDFLTYYERVSSLHAKWGFRKMLVETNAGGYFVAQEVENFIRRDGSSLVVDKHHASGRGGSKEQRWAAVLEPKYESKSIFHCRGGFTTALEDELVSAKPRHDDLKDALTSAISQAKPPMKKRKTTDEAAMINVVQGRFGGRVRIR